MSLSEATYVAGLGAVRRKGDVDIFSQNFMNGRPG